ncbi:MAG TPA: hypothetical protein VFE78_25660 [Gemmataceae bacterium]|jgi:hypothetical protein|nr:hypothetical protein [Gemmataceae bacterium]
MMRLWRAALVSAFWLAGCLTASAAGPLNPADFDRVRGLIKPAAAEATWARVPWQTSLWEARRKAAAQGKPILLWEMDGHPLGCT